MWRQYCHLLAIIGIFEPSWPLNIAIAMAPVESWTVSSRTSTSGVCQDSFRNPGAGKSRICQDNGSEYMQVCLGTPLWTLHRTTKAIAQMNADWKVGKAQYAEFNVPTCGKIAVWQLCRETQPSWNSHDSWWPELNMFGSMPWCSFPWHKVLQKAGFFQKSCIEALLIESGFSLPYAFRYKMPRFLPRTPLPPEWAVQLFMWDGTVYWNLLCLFRGGGSQPKSSGFVTANGRTATSFADRLLAHTQQASAHTPKKQKNNHKRCADWNYKQSHALS